MTEDLVGPGPETPWHRTVSEKWDRRQSEWLVLVIGCSIASFLDCKSSMSLAWERCRVGFGGRQGRVPGSPSWSGKCVRAPGRARPSGGAICLRLLMRLRFGGTWTRTGMPELIALFVFTYAATRFARGRTVADEKERRGRRASQIIANLGIAGLFAGSVEVGFFIAGLGALAEAAADTVSSETGQALGARAWSLTTGREVPAGTDGGISVRGTLFGITAAGLVAALAIMSGAVDGMAGLIVFVAGCAGLVFDSLLGATLERCGWLGNDLVNFTSTAFAGFVALQGARFLLGPQPYW